MRDRLLAVSLSIFLIGLSIGTLFLTIRPAYLPYISITTVDTASANIDYQYNFDFTEAIRFAGYDQPEADLIIGQPIPITLYWEVLDEVKGDYLFQLCLHDMSGSAVTCQPHHPSNGRYPTSAWEVGYLVEDEVLMLTPVCLSAGIYRLNLSILPLRPDLAKTTVVESAQKTTVLNLGTLTLTNTNPPPNSNLVVCINGQCNQNTLTIENLRQSVTVISSQSGHSRGHVTPASVQLIAGEETASWQPLTPFTAYQCPNGTLATTTTFIVDGAVQPATYRVAVDGLPADHLAIAVNSRPRSFDIPQTIQHPTAYRFGDALNLLGYDLDLTLFQPGDTIEIVTYWQATRQMRQEYFASLHFLDNRVEMWSQDDDWLGDAYLNIFWTPGEVVTDVHHIKINPYTPPGLYSLELGLYHYDDNDFHFLPITLETGDPVANPFNIILEEARVHDPAFGQPPLNTVQAVIGEGIHLLGYNLLPDVVNVTEPLALTLFWQNEGKLQKDYTVFTQLIGPDGRVWAQQDNPPQQGRYPTSQWQTPDQVVDRYHLEISPDAPAGTYRLITGMYDLTTGERLAAVNAQGDPWPNNAILLTTLGLN